MNKWTSLGNHFISIPFNMDTYLSHHIILIFWLLTLKYFGPETSEFFSDCEQLENHFG